MANANKNMTDAMEIAWDKATVVDVIRNLIPEEQFSISSISAPYIGSIKYLFKDGSVGYSSPEIVGRLYLHTLAEMPIESLVAILEQLRADHRVTGVR